MQKSNSIRKIQYNSNITSKMRVKVNFPKINGNSRIINSIFKPELNF